MILHVGEGTRHSAGCGANWIVLGEFEDAVVELLIDVKDIKP